MAAITPRLSGTMSAEPAAKWIEPAARIAAIWSAQISGFGRAASAAAAAASALKVDVDHRGSPTLSASSASTFSSTSGSIPQPSHRHPLGRDLEPALLQPGQRPDAGQHPAGPALGQLRVDHRGVGDPVVAEERRRVALDRGARGGVLHRAGQPHRAVQRRAPPRSAARRPARRRRASPRAAASPWSSWKTSGRAASSRPLTAASFSGAMPSGPVSSASRSRSAKRPPPSSRTAREPARHRRRPVGRRRAEADGAAGLAGEAGRPRRGDDLRGRLGAVGAAGGELRRAARPG